MKGLRWKFSWLYRRYFVHDGVIRTTWANARDVSKFRDA